MSWALEGRTALTPLDLAPSQKQARVVNGPVKALWKVEEGPLYEQAGYEYEQIVRSQMKKV